MKKMLKWTILKTFGVVILIGLAIYFAYQYFGGKSITNPLTGNTDLGNSNNEEMPTYSAQNQLFESAKRSESVAIEFNQDMTLKDADGKTIEIKKGSVVKGKLRVSLNTGAANKYYLVPIESYGVKEVEIDGSKVVAVMGLEAFNAMQTRVF